MNGKKDTMVWVSLGLNVISLTLITFLYFQSKDKVDYSDLRKSNLRSYTAIIEECAELVSREFEIEYENKPSSINEVVSPLLKEMETAE